MKNKFNYKLVIGVSIAFLFFITFNFSQSNNIINSNDNNTTITGNENTNISGNDNTVDVISYNFHINGETLLVENNEDIEQIQKLVENIEEELINASLELEIYKQDIDDQKIQLIIEQEKENISQYIEEKNYVDAINILQNTLCETYPTEIEFQKLLYDTITEYLEYTASEVDKLLEEQNYIEARLLVETVEKTNVEDLQNNSVFQLLKNKVNSHQDVQLCNLKIVNQSGNIQMLTAEGTSQGSLSESERYRYSNMNLIKKSGSGNSSMEFYLGQEYTLLEVTIAVSDEYPTKQNPTIVTFTGDGGKILFTSGELTRSSDVIENYRIDVSNEERLTIIIESTSHSYAVYPMIVNPVLYT